MSEKKVNDLIRSENSVKQFAQKATISTTVISGTSGGGFLAGGSTGAAVGTIFCPGVGTAVGYLVGSAAGIAGGAIAGKKMADKVNDNF